MPKKSKAPPNLDASEVMVLSQTKKQTPKTPSGVAQAETAFGDLIRVGSSTPSFFKAPPGTWDTYRRISRHPTVFLVKLIVDGPIIGNAFNWKKRDDDVPDEWVTLIKETFDPQRVQLKEDLLMALEMGCAPMEKIWQKNRKGQWTIPQFKPLKWDYTEAVVDDSGNVVGLVNKVPGFKAVTLEQEEMLWFTYNGGPGNPYGVSRNENIRTIWAISEQVSQKYGSYLKKKAGVFLICHFPVGQSRDPIGVVRPNQWHAQRILDAAAAGQSFALPNLFVPIQRDGTVDLREMGSLAGKSSWIVDVKDPGESDYSPGFILALEYFDYQLFRGWGRPERSGLESKHASRGDSKEHGEVGIDDGETIDGKIASCLNKQAVDDILVVNYGEEARGAVYHEPPPLSEDQQIICKELIKVQAAGSQTGPAVFNLTDMRALLTKVGIPVTEDATAVGDKKDSQPKLIIPDPNKSTGPTGSGGLGGAPNKNKSKPVKNKKRLDRVNSR